MSAAGEVSVGRGIDAERGVEAAEGRVGASADQDRPQSERVFRVVIWSDWGDCPSCGGKTEVGTSALLTCVNGEACRMARRDVPEVL